MNKQVVVGAVAALLVSASGACADNALVLLSPEDFGNRVQVSMAGNGNRLEVAQELTAAGTNSIMASIQGDLNGGPLGASFSGPALRAGLRPGSLMQRGFNNAMTVDVTGTSNLFAFSQTGSGNSLHASITGHSNQAAVVQVGMNNYASFSQNGVGNIVSITQRSW